MPRPPKIFDVNYVEPKDLKDIRGNSLEDYRREKPFVENWCEEIITKFPATAEYDQLQKAMCATTDPKLIGAFGENGLFKFGKTQSSYQNIIYSTTEYDVNFQPLDKEFQDYFRNRIAGDNYIRDYQNHHFFNFEYKVPSKYVQPNGTFEVGSIPESTVLYFDNYWIADTPKETQSWVILFSKDFKCIKAIPIHLLRFLIYNYIDYRDSRNWSKYLNDSYHFGKSLPGHYLNAALDPNSPYHRYLDYMIFKK